MILSFDDFVKKCKLTTSNKILHQTTMNMYYKFVNNHFEMFFGTKDWLIIDKNIHNPSTVLDKLKSYEWSISMKLKFLAVLNQLYHCNEYTKEYAMLKENYRDVLLSESTIEDYDWATKLLELDAKKDNSKWDYQNYIIALIMYYHPRRLYDYSSTIVVRETTCDNTIKDNNYYIVANRKFIFNKFKNSEAITAGCKEFTLNADLNGLFDKWLNELNTSDNMFIGKRGKAISSNYLCTLIHDIGLPTTTENRKLQESKELLQGKTRTETSNKFNHSITCQQLNYNKKIVNEN